MEKHIKQILKQYWGYEAFRFLQEDIIMSVLESRDTLAILPTGGGKSICFQVPSMAKAGLCLVVSPLIALMKDQVENLKLKGIQALSIYTGMSFMEVKKTLQNACYGNYKFLYVSPERLESNLFLEYLPALPVSLIAVDEAHCVSQWGYDFRPPYLRIAALREHLPGVPILALTASATKEVQDDICNKLAFKKDQQRFHKSFERPNLSYSVFNVAAKQQKLLEVCKNVKGSGIVYCKSRKRTKEVAELLAANNIISDFYHAGLANNVRAAKQESWIKNETRIIVCTNAFGMGIDKGDVRIVVHYDVPDALENYYQEAGRAGRDEKKAYAVLLFYDNELTDLEKQSAIRYPPLEEVKEVFKALVNYFQLPSGLGEGLSYDFDINDFAKKFNLNIYTVNYSLKILEQEEIISYNEQFFKPSSVVFTSSKEDLHQFENFNAELDRVIKGLLRSYEGIFDYPSIISETSLAKFIKSDKEELIKSLKKLHALKIIEYNPQKDKAQISFLKNRQNVQDLSFNIVDLNKRKAAFEKRSHAMISYIKKTLICRSKIIGNYFGDTLMRDCGICDNCINQKNLEVSKEEFDFISNNILKLVSNNPISSKNLLQQLRNNKKDKVWKVLNYLQSEKKVTVNREGMLSKQG